MALQTGLLTVEDLLDVQNQSVLDFGMERVEDALQADLAAHNEQMLDMVSTLATPTTDRAETYGATTGGKMMEVDEEGRAPTQKTKGFAKVAYPLRKFQFNLSWTRNFFRRSTPADMAMQMQNAQRAHRVGVVKRIQRAFYFASNYTYRDHLVDNYALDVKRLVNADGAIIPTGPNGEAFDGSTHTHYNAIDWGAATADQKNDAVKALVEDVIEHGHGEMPIVAIARGDESKFDDVADFEPYKPIQIVPGDASDRARGVLQTGNLYNRAIGVLKSSGAEVWVKPWGVVGYMLCTDLGAEADDKPLKFRQNEQATAQGLQIVAMIEAHPLVAEYMEAEFGFGAYTRTNGAVLYTGGGAYTDPTIAV